MKHLTPYRIAAYLLVVFFLGHTLGGMLSQASLGLAADSVFAAMKDIHFDFFGSDATWYGFWFGFGLMTSVFLLFSAVVAWRLDAVAPTHWPVVATIAWAFFAAHLANAILSWTYFFAGPGVIASLVAALLGIGAWRKQNGSGTAH